MKKKPKIGLILILTVAGVALTLLGMLELHFTPNALQYCALPSTEKKTAVQLSKARDKVAESLSEASNGIAFSMVNSSIKLSLKGRSADCTVYAIGEGWLDIYPRYLEWGRRLSESELANGGRVCMMDASLAFQIFGAPLPENPRIDFLGHSYRVVGTVRHAGSLLGGQGVGDQLPYDMYVPLPAAIQDNFLCTVEMLSIIPAAETGVEPQFLQAAKNYWREADAMINLPKEAMRATVLPRIVLMVYGIYALGLLLTRMNRFTARLRARYREATQHNYLKKLWPRLIGLILVHIAGYAVLMGLAAGLAVFSSQPIYIFTEWVPEKFVAWSSISKVFWNLTQTAAGLVRVGSRELRVIAFWGGVLRWATIMLLTASAMRHTRLSNDRKENVEP